MLQVFIIMPLFLLLLIHIHVVILILFKCYQHIALVSFWLAEFLKLLKWMTSMKAMSRYTYIIILYYSFVSVLKTLEMCYITQATGEDYSVEPADSRRPFRALLDVGLVKTTTGNRVFGALKVFHANINHLCPVFF